MVSIKLHKGIVTISDNTACQLTQGGSDNAKSQFVSLVLWILSTV